MDSITKGDVIRRYPEGRYTEAEARYIAGRLLARTNGGYVPAEMKVWWRAIDAIAPAWLTGESITFVIHEAPRGWTHTS